MYNPQELQRKAQLNLHGVDTNAKTTIKTNPPKQENNKSFLATIGNFVNNIVMGAVKSIEGIVDAGAMLVGLFGADVDDFVSYDFTSDVFGTDEEGEGLFEWSWGRNLADVSYLDNDHIVNQIADGVGGMLPTVALAFVSGGTSLAGTAASAGAKAATIGAKIAQTGTFVASAMGNASESALQDGANYNQALGYGALSGVTEGVIESISGGIGGTKMGTVLGKQIAKKTGTKLATTFVSEGLEEVASDLIDPVYQRITGVNEEAKVDTNNLFRTFVVGGSIGAIMGGVGRKLTAHQNADKGGEKFLKVAEEVSEIEDAITEKENALTSENKTQEDIDGVGVKVVDKIINSVKTISDHLQSMTESQRSNALNIINGEESIVSNLFEVNGEIKSGVLEDLELSKKRHYSANSILKSQLINEELSNINQEKGWNLEVDDSQINEDERVKLAQFYAVRNGLSEKSGENLRFVVVSGKGANKLDGFYSKKNKTIYISRDTLSDSLKESSKNALYQTTIHETEHFVDNAPLRKYLINYAQQEGELLKQTVEELERKDYGVTKEDVESAIKKVEVGAKLSQKEEIAYTELSANLASKLLGNEEFVKRLARSNRGLFNKVKNFISDKITSGKKSEAYKTAQHIFENALKEIKEKNVGEAEQFDNSSALSYNFRKKVDNANGREKANQESEERISGRRDALHNNREAGANISVSFNDGRSESLRTITSKEKSKQISEIADVIYYNATNEIQNNLKWHCKYEGIELFFLKTKEGVEQSFVYDGKNLFVKENTTEKKLVDILDIIKPINRTVNENKIAHISNNRWDNFINNHSGAYLTRISIQQFLDMTTESYVDQRQINARSESISRQANFNISDTYQQEIYIEIDFNTKKVVNHEGRHRLTSLLNQGNAFVDIFIIPTQKLNIETITNIEIEGQFNNNKYKLSIVKAESDIFKKAIYNSFRREDNNIRYSLKDSEKSLNEKFSGLKPIQIKDEKEYQSLERELEHRNGNHPSKIDWALTDKYLYIVKDNTYDSFTPIVKIDCKKYQDFFMHLTQMIDYNNYNPIITIDAWMTEIFAHPDSIEWFNPDPLYNPYKKQIVDNEIATTLDEESESSNYKNKDSFGRELSEQQIEFFKDSKVRDRYGRLKEVYHGTYGEFYTFDKSLLGTNIHSQDAKLGFFFTASKRLAEDYSSQAKSHKMYNLMYKVANGDTEVLKFLSDNSNFYDAEKIERISATKEYSEINKIKELEKNNKHDVFSVYLDIKNPYIEDWNKKMHNSLDMVRAITKALTNGYDGVIIKRVDASITESRPADDLYIVFEPNQIKDVNNKAPTKNPDIRFSKKSFSEQVDDVLAGADTTSTHLKVRESTPKILIDIGLDNKPMLITSVHTKTAVSQKVANKNIHALSIETLKRLPELLESPAIIMDSNKENSIVAFVNAVDTNNNPVMCAINITGKGFYNNIRIDANLISSVYGKDTNPIGFIERAVDDNRVLYWDKKMSQDLFSIPGLQLPDNLLNLDSNIIIRKSKWIVNTNSENFSNQIKFSRKANPTYTLSDGQVKKKVANFTKLKVYSKVEAESIINSILETNFNLEDYSVRISGKTKAEAIEVLWKTLNTADAGKRTGISLKIADYIIDNTIIESIYLEEENQIYTETISFLKPYLHSVDLKALKGEIKYRYDTDNSVYLLWGKRKGEDGQTVDQIAMELAESGFFIDAENEADIFFEMDRAYREAVRALKKKSDKFLADTLGKEERNKLRQDIAKDILRAFDSNGKKSKLAEIIEQQKERAKVWKDLYYEEKQRNSAINNLLYEVGKIRDIHFGDFQNSTQSHNLLFRGSIERLSAIKHRGDLNKSGTRSIVAGLNEWYSKDNPVVGDRFIEDISYILNKISSGTGKLTAEEIKWLATAVAYFRHFIETNNKIFRAGKYVDAKPIAEDYIKKIAETQNLKIGLFGRLFDWTFNNSKHSYMQHFNDPMSVARYMDKYGDGFFTQTLESFREGAVNSAILEMELNASVEEFYDKHKKFLKNLKAKTVKYNNVEIPADKALYLYMALNREQALMGLARSGFSYKDDKGKTVRVAGFETNEDLTLDDIKIIASEVQSELEKQFTEEEIEYIKIAEKLFNEDCKKLKSERDKTRLGYSNVVDDYYIPIRRAYIAQSVDVDSLQFELDRVSNLSFNKSAVKGAKNELFIESLDLVLSRHLRGIAQYYHLSNVIDNFNIIYNMDIGGNANRVKSIASESVNVWDKGKTYLQDLISDIQGIKRGEGSRAFGFIRGSYAKYQLGANPKVWFTQLSSFFASMSILDYGSVVKGLGVKTNDVDKYCPLAKLRNSDNTAALAQGVLDKVDKVSNVLMKPIGIMDRLVVKKLFGACQVQIQKNTGLKIGTEENKVKAGELLQKVILETQQNTIATERSQAMRSSSELMKTMTMFTSDSVKIFGRVVDSWGKVFVINARIKNTNDPVEIERLKKERKPALKEATKTTSAFVSIAIFMALIAQAFRTLYNKDDEEDNIVENMTVDAVGNLFGGLPIFKDVYAKLVEGYDFDGYQYSAINDLLDSMSDVINLTGDIFSGNADSRDIALNIKKMSYAIGQLFGIPVRNVYNVFYGLTNRISPATAYKIDDIFYKQSYNSDLKKAIKNNDEAMIATIAGLIMNENVGDFENGSTRSEVNRLLSAGFDVLPQSVPNSVTINEVQHSLTGPQQEKFRKAYSGAITAVDKLVSSNGYKIATDEAKAKAIKYVYRYYYYEAQHQALNVDLDSKLYLFGQIVPIEKMALALAEVPLLVENSTNKKTAVQRYLQASKLTSAQKYMLMGYFGYKNTKGEGVVKSAINKTSLTKEQKKLLLEKCGY